MIIWYPSGDHREILQTLCEMRDKGKLQIVQDQDVDGVWFYEITATGVIAHAT